MLSVQAHQHTKLGIIEEIGYFFHFIDIVWGLLVGKHRDLFVVRLLDGDAWLASTCLRRLRGSLPLFQRLTVKSVKTYVSCLYILPALLCLRSFSFSPSSMLL
jgi:hypothetical protein